MQRVRPNKCQLLGNGEQLNRTETLMLKRSTNDVWPNWLFKLTPTLRLVPSSRCAPYGAA
jgi:hypothetical protein